LGFLNDLKLSKKYKKGIKEALGGNFNEALNLFDDVFLHASDLKLQNENLIWYHICKALQYAKGGDFISGKKEYNEYLSVTKSYIDICNMTPGIGTETRVNVWKNQIKEFLLLYNKQIDLLK